MNARRRWIIGSFAIYAVSPFTALEVYHFLSEVGLTGPFGTLLMDTDDEVDWVNMAYGVHPDALANLALPH